MAAKKAERLNDRHQWKNDTNCRCSTGVDLSDKEGVGHVVGGGDQHTDDGWYRQLRDELWNRCLCHSQKFLLSLFFCSHSVKIPPVCSSIFSKKNVFFLYYFPIIHENSPLCKQCTKVIAVATIVFCKNFCKNKKIPGNRTDFQELYLRFYSKKEWLMI